MFVGWYSILSQKWVGLESGRYTSIKTVIMGRNRLINLLISYKWRRSGRAQCGNGGNYFLKLAANVKCGNMW